MNFKFDDKENSDVEIIRKNSSTVKKKEPYKKFEYRFLPHQIKNHGPAEHKFEKIKYSASESPYEKTGSQEKKILICDSILDEKSVSYTLEQKIDEFERNIPSIILDENIEKEKLAKHLSENGYNVFFLGRGVSDEIICKKTWEKNAIVVTADVDFTVSLRKEQKYEPIYIDQKSESLDENVRIISEKMKMYHNRIFG